VTYLSMASQLTLSDAQPNGVVLHPTDLATMLKTKATGSCERLDGDGAFSTPPTTMFRPPLVVSRAIAQGTALIGDFTQATVYVREAVTLRVSDADQDAFVRYEVVMLAEGRFGLACWAPQAFCLVALK
jgi:HK97 family phage major capsid protein